MKLNQFATFVVAAGLLAPFSVSASAKHNCKKVSAEGWGLTKQLAKSQAHTLLLASTGNILTQTDKFSKPKNSCSFSILGWTCKTTAKVCKH
mgnify:CR=1 FL=1